VCVFTLVSSSHLHFNRLHRRTILLQQLHNTHVNNGIHVSVGQVLVESELDGVTLEDGARDEGGEKLGDVDFVGSAAVYDLANHFFYLVHLGGFATGQVLVRAHIE